MRRRKIILLALTLMAINAINSIGSNYPDPQKEKKKKHPIPLFDAVLHCDVGSVKALLAAGADVNTKGEGDETALLLAASKDKCPIEVTDTLLAAGADPNMKTTLGWTPLMWAASSYRIDIVKSFIKAGANVNETNRYGRTALMLVVQQSGVEDIVKLLIASGTDVKMRDSYNKTALDYAVSGKIKKLLKEAAAK